MSSKRRLLILMVVLLPLLAAGAVGVYLVNDRMDGAANDGGQTDASSAIPDLGPRTYVPPTDDDSDDETDEQTDESTEDSPEETEEADEERQSSEREIDILLSNLALAAKSGNRKGMALSHDALRKARPTELVDARVRNALDNEQRAVVRIQFFLAFHSDEASFDWAMHVYDTRTAKFMGTDDNYRSAEIDELKLVATRLFESLVENWRTDEQADSRLMALLRNVLDRENPDWLLEVARAEVFLVVIKHEITPLAQALQQELRGILQRRTADERTRGTLFIAFILTYEPHEGVFEDLARSEWWDYAAELANWFNPRRGGQSAWPVNWLDILLESDEVPKLFERLLQGAMPVEHKRELIRRIADYNVPNGRAMIEAGLDRKDGNYPDYLIAFGSFASTEADLQRLTAIADDPDVAHAQGAIEGLRRSGLAAADGELRQVLEQGANLGVKSQALGAMLSRARDATKLLEEYLDENKDASLRAVAVAHIPIEDTDRLMKVCEEDSSPRVRQAALNRLGSIKPASTRERKALRGFFLTVRMRDSSQVIRAAAHKYADALLE